jgi:hypothetical protein
MSKPKVDLFGDYHQVKIAMAAMPKAANDTPASDAPQEYLQSSKEKFARLNPYFQMMLVELTTSFPKYTLPDDIFNKLAEAISIKNLGDTYSTELMITVAQLQPLVS